MYIWYRARFYLSALPSSHSCKFPLPSRSCSVALELRVQHRQLPPAPSSVRGVTGDEAVFDLPGVPCGSALTAVPEPLCVEAGRSAVVVEAEHICILSGRLW